MDNSIKDTSFFCCYCGVRFSFLVRSTADHLIPTSRGGVNSNYNKRNCCYNCNHSKGSLYLEQWLARLEKLKSKHRKPGDESILNTIEIVIENIKYLIEYVQSSGDKLFIDKYHYENYLEKRHGNNN